MKTIKQSILLIFLTLGVSFSSFSAVITVPSMGNQFKASCGVSDGATFDPMKLSCKSVYYRGCHVHVLKIYPQLPIYKYQLKECGRLYTYKLFSKPAVCAPPSYINESTGICEEPPVCTENEKLNPDTLECEEVPFCERDSTNEALFAAEQRCAAEKGVFSFQCDNGDQLGIPQGLTTNCAQPNACVMGLPNWPACLGDLDPTEPPAPPDSSFDSGSPDSITPNNPSFDKTEPDSVAPTDSTDKAVLTAVQNLNRDSNQGFTALNTDLNQGFNDVNNQLNKLNQTNNAVGQQVADQMNQDYQLHLAEKQLSLQQTGAINNAASNIGNLISNQTGTLDGSISGLGSKLDEINENLSKLDNCDPETDPYSCEGKHGLDGAITSDIMVQVADVGGAGLDSVEGEVIAAVKGYVNDSGTKGIESHIDSAIGLAMSALPNVSDCTPFKMPTPLGEVVFDCEFSVRFKVVASFLMYIYTAWTLIDILLTGVTPVSGTVPYMSRR